MISVSINTHTHRKREEGTNIQLFGKVELLGSLEVDVDVFGLCLERGVHMAFGVLPRLPRVLFLVRLLLRRHAGHLAATSQN